MTTRTDVSICSRALMNLGARPISSLDDQNDAAQMLKLVYPEIRAGIAASYNWECLKKRTQATRADGSPGGFQYQFILPAECKGTPAGVFPSIDARQGTRRFEIRQRRIVTDFPEVWVEYSVETDEASWPAWFANLVMSAVCAEIALVITDQQNVKDHWEAKTYGTPSEGRVGGLMGECMTLDAQGSGNVGFVDDYLVASRFGEVYTGGSDW